MKTWITGAAIALVLAGAGQANAQGYGDCPETAAAQPAKHGPSRTVTRQRGGTGNLARYIQSGGANQVSLNQFGSGNAAGISQQGSGNTAAVGQFGSDNTVSLAQSGTGNVACVVQVGQGLNASVSQSGGQTTSFVQTPFGARNISTEYCLAAQFAGGAVSRSAW
jgi:minor curlin subunit